MRRPKHPDSYSFSIYEAMDGTGDRMTIYVAGDFKIPLKTKIQGREWRHVNPGIGLYNPDYVPKHGDYAWRPFNKDEVKQIQDIRIDTMNKKSIRERGRNLTRNEKRKIKNKTIQDFKGVATVALIESKNQKND